MSKSQLGQFYTTHYNYILNEFKIPDDTFKVMEPFAGEGHLTSFAVAQMKVIESVMEYDIEPKNNFIKQRNTLLDPPEYKGFYIITNPPYLARNKNTCKEIYDKYQENDLYKCFIRNIITNVCIGGIIIIPLNFFSSIRKADVELRKQFMEVYEILKIRIFEEQVFNDTTYTVCVIQFVLNNSTRESNNVSVEFYPSKECELMVLDSSNLYTFGGHMLCLKQNMNISVERLTKKNVEKCNTRLELKCIDDSKHSKLGLYFKEHDEEIFVDETENLSARAYAGLIIEPSINIDQQRLLAQKFNDFISKNRKKYHSLFLTNYRESKNGFARKRISMSHGYEIINYLLGEMQTQ